MSHSSTSSSSNPPRRPWLAAGVGLLTVLLSVELFLRMAVVESAIGKPDLYFDPSIGPRIEDARAVLDSEGEIDVLFIGSSTTETNINPSLFDSALASRGQEVTSFNAGISNARLLGIGLLLDHVWLELLEPKVVVESVRLGEVVSPFGWEKLLSGRYEPLWLDDSLAARARVFALDHSTLLQYGNLLTKKLGDAAMASDGGSVGIGSAAIRHDERGFLSIDQTLSESLKTVDTTEILGGEAALNGFSVAPDASVFEPGLGLLAQTIGAAQDAGVIYVLVNMPEHSQKYSSTPGGEALYALYVETLRSFATEHNVAFIDVTDGDPYGYADSDLFWDFHHMNSAGARVLTKQLADAIASAGLIPRDQT